MNIQGRRFHRTGSTKYPLLGITLPSVLSRELDAEGFTHYDLEISERGMVIIPLRGSSLDAAEIVAGWGNGASNQDSERDK